MTKLDVAVIGAGFAGLGTGAALRRAGVANFSLIEQGGDVGHFWSKTYDRIHLHSPWHDLPNDGGLIKRYPKFKSRDELIRYFGEYADRFDLRRSIRFHEKLLSVTRDGDLWRLETSVGPLSARYVAIATATNRVPSIPNLPGRKRFEGTCIHSSEYRNGAPFAGKSVLVIGSGNSAAEVALDLVEHRARRVQMWVRGPRHVISLKTFGRIATVGRVLGMFSEKKVAAALRIRFGTPEFESVVAQRDRLVARFSQDLSAYGIGRPAAPPMRDALINGRIPLFDQGTVREIRRGRIGVIDGNLRAIETFTEKGVRFSDGEEAFDAIVLGTGFEPGLEEFIADRELLAPQRGRKFLPVTDGQCRSTVYPSMFFPGFDPTPAGGQSLGHLGWASGEAIAAELART